MYQANPQRVLHRVVAITTNEEGKREFTFEGDSNNIADPQAVGDKQIVGRLIGGVPRLGWVLIRFNQALHRIF